MDELRHASTTRYRDTCPFTGQMVWWETRRIDGTDIGPLDATGKPIDLEGCATRRIDKPD